MKITISFWVRGIEFETVEDMVRVYKTCPDMNYDTLFNEYLSLKTDIEEYNEFKEKAISLWDVCTPFTPAEAMEKFNDNTERRLLLLSFFEPEDVLKNMEATLIDKQTISKKQNKTMIDGVDIHDKLGLIEVTTNMIECVTHNYDDTYELYRVDSDVMGSDEDVYFVKCKDASHDKFYYLFVQENTDAITAIASTMIKPDGNPISKEEYLAIVSET